MNQEIVSEKAKGRDLAPVLEASLRYLAEKRRQEAEQRRAEVHRQLDFLLGRYVAVEGSR